MIIGGVSSSGFGPGALEDCNRFVVVLLCGLAR